MENKHYLIALNKMPSVGPRTILTLMQKWPQLEELFAIPKNHLEKNGLPLRLIQTLIRFNPKMIEEDLRWGEETQNHLITIEDPEYPSLLREIHAPPVVLYAKGTLECLQQSTLAIIGSRKPSITGKETAWRFASELAAYPLAIVSGLALGIDCEAHKGAIHAKGKTIAVLGTGIDHIYPKQHTHLAEAICQNGLLISEFPLKTTPMARHFPYRNRIISGLSLCILVIEAAMKSGSLITAHLALEQNRDVLAVPGSILNPQAEGCHRLLQQGAKLVTSIQDVLDELGLEMPLQQEIEKIRPLASSNENLVKCIGFEEITTLDQLIARSSLSIDVIACTLATLELQGHIKAVPGGYMRCI